MKCIIKDCDEELSGVIEHNHHIVEEHRSNDLDMDRRPGQLKELDSDD